MGGDQSEEIRPPVDPSMNRDEFERWYWSVDLLRAFCTALGLPTFGVKADLRARVSAALHGEPPVSSPKRQRRSRVNWQSVTLSHDTLITGDIAFGPRVRGFFRERIGPSFVCHGDFMNWVRGNIGLTLGDAVDAWWMLDSRKDDPDFRREIAECNTYLRYLRSFRDANPALGHDQAKRCWDGKKVRPAPGGDVRYQPEDLRFLTRPD